jgi:hypothetical protein
MKNHKLLALCVVGSLVMVGCGDDPKPPASEADQGMDQGTDLGADQAPDLMPDMEPDQAMCAPQMLCLPGECGQVDNGCGGQLDCGVCLCKDGQAQVPSCGTCELGTISCAMGDRYPSCEQPKLPAGVQLDCDAVVYFDPTAPQTGMGTREVPYSNLDEAVARVNALGGGAVVMGGDVVVEFGREVELPEAVMLLGGFDAQTFAYNPARKPTLRLVPSQPTHGAILVQNATRKTVLHNLKVEVAASLPGVVLHGIRALEAPGLVLSAVDVVVADGAPGLDGGVGASGEDGKKGQDGRADGQRVLGGTPGSGCLIGLLEILGGDGGAGGVPPLQVGQTGKGERGGVGADAPSGQPLGGSPGFEGTMAPENGFHGGDGSPYRDPAQAGAPGRVAVAVEGGRVVAQGAGGDGANGGRGASGGGGGGATYCTTALCGTLRRGPSGGGGGAGGCGGKGGSGGQAGGTVVGVLAVNSTGMEFLASTVTVGQGGAGGKGGAGGAGGGGGAGGVPGLIMAQQGFTLSGGFGGRGGPGQRGGKGGGGAGGSSLGVLCENTQLRDVATQVQVMVGAGGPGAEGADAGLSTPMQGCMR